MKLVMTKEIQNETEHGDAYVTQEVFQVRNEESVKSLVERAMPYKDQRPDWHYSEVRFIVKFCR